MSQPTELLKELISLSGLSGFETPATQVVQEKWQPLSDELALSPLGSLHALKRGTGTGKSIMISTHVDAIGLIVKKVDGEFLRISDLGGIDIRVLPGQEVLVHTERGALPGVIIQPPAHLLPEGAAKGAVALKNLLVDLGLLAREVARKVQVGNPISFANDPAELSGGLVAGHSLDNRASIAALTLCLEALQSRNHLWDVWAAATVQEEIGHPGAYTSAFKIRPDLAIAVDVTFASGPGASGWETFKLGSGPTLGWGAVNHPALFDEFKALAGKLEIPVTHLVPAATMGSGLGSTQTYSGDYDIQLFDEATREEYGLDDLRLGDFVAIIDADSTYGWHYKKGAVTVSIVVHSDCVMSGHGPGATTLFTSTSGKIKPRIDPEANIANFLNLR